MLQRAGKAETSSTPLHPAGPCKGLRADLRGQRVYGVWQHRAPHGDLQDQEGVPRGGMFLLPHEATTLLHIPQAH